MKTILPVVTGDPSEKVTLPETGLKLPPHPTAAAPAMHITDKTQH
jgi:hypothetical protein